MSKKFNKDRSVSVAYAKIPLYYTGIIHPNNINKELVLMDRLGKNYTACWRNNTTSKTGIEFLIQAIDGGFIFKDKIYKFNKINKSFVI
jgi:hypothetical protein